MGYCRQATILLQRYIIYYNCRHIPTPPNGGFCDCWRLWLPHAETYILSRGEGATSAYFLAQRDGRNMSEIPYY